MHQKSHIQLSAVVMVFNEINTIEKCLKQLVDLCDEIVVVDDCSTDGTWEYLASLGDKVRAVQNKHTTFAAQREFGKALATGQWILTMDGDEYVTPELAKEIRRAIATETVDGFYIHRRNPYPKTLSGFYLTKHPRLIRAEKCRWIQTDNPHSPLELRGLRMKTLRGGHLEHEALPNVAVMLRKNINRSLIVAAQQRAQGRRTQSYSLFLSVIIRSLKFYLFKGAFRFGSSGVVMALAMGQEAFAKSAFLVESSIDSPEALQDGGPGSYPAGTAFVVQSNTLSHRRSNAVTPPIK